MDRLLLYLAFVCFNMGNYYGYGDQKFVPSVMASFVRQVVGRSTDRARSLLEQCESAMFSITPSALGYPSKDRQSAYYPTPGGGPYLTVEDIKSIDSLLEQESIGLDNTLLKLDCSSQEGRRVEVWQSSIERNNESFQEVGTLASGITVTLHNELFSPQLGTVCASLCEALRLAANDHQKQTLRHIIQHFETDDVVEYDKAQVSWLKDIHPQVEVITGFVEQYRDPAGRRAEFETLVAISAPAMSEKLATFVSRSREFIAKLPWVTADESGGLGPFEAAKVELPTYTAVEGPYTR